jgi:hypothetical protein
MRGEWRRLQPVDFNLHKGQTPQAEAYASKSQDKINLHRMYVRKFEFDGIA